jgi:multiple sugar transport system substrate-binding protein
MPDVFSVTFPGNPEPSMFKEGWFAPLAINVSDLPDYVRNTLFEGFTLFNGEVYSFPTLNNLNHVAPVWYFKKPVADAGYSAMPQTYREFRALAKKITEQSKGSVYGIILPIAFIDRMNNTITDMVYAAGGPGNIDWKTGDYQFDSPWYFDVFEFLTGLKDDGSVHPISVNLDMRQARERWAVGEAAILFDGSWNAGMLLSNFPGVLDQVAVAEPIRKDPRTPYTIYRGPPRGTYFISSKSKYISEATEIIKQFTSDDYYINVANRMDQPPLKLSRVKDAKVHPVFIDVVDMFQRTMAYEPTPMIKNPASAEVFVEMRPIHPNPAEILQGYYSGAIKDWKSELRKYNVAMTNERVRAIKKIQDQGHKVSIDDWKFSNWVYGMNYTTDKY